MRFQKKPEKRKKNHLQIELKVQETTVHQNSKSPALLQAVSGKEKKINDKKQKNLRARKSRSSKKACEVYHRNYMESQ